MHIFASKRAAAHKCATMLADTDVHDVVSLAGKGQEHKIHDSHADATHLTRLLLHAGILNP